MNFQIQPAVRLSERGGFVDPRLYVDFKGLGIKVGLGCGVWALASGFPMLRGKTSYPITGHEIPQGSKQPNVGKICRIQGPMWVLFVYLDRAGGFQVFCPSDLRPQRFGPHKRTPQKGPLCFVKPLRKSQVSYLSFYTLVSCTDSRKL